jgi:hypothetical protein
MNINETAPPGAAQNAPETVTFDIRQLSLAQFAQLGLAQLAYVKPIVLGDGAPGFAIHAADGTPMALAPDRELARAAILQHEMTPALVH